jgi:AcrR family transcriptional regulator
MRHDDTQTPLTAPPVNLSAVGGQPLTSGRRPGDSVTSAAEGKGQARTLILDAAEWLFAEHGISSVSNRQIGAAAGQGNTSAVGYHFGSKDELIRALIRRFDGEAEVLRAAMVNQIGDSAELREWVRCLVFPYTDTLAARRPPTWYARLNAQIMADPVLRNIQLEEAVSASLQQVIRGLEISTPELPAPVLRERELMAGHILIQTCADFERGLADAPASGKTWRKVGSGLVDALVGLWSAPVTR